MVDGKFCTVGSANLNARSLRWDYEENAVIVDSCTTQQLVQLFDGEKKDSFLLNEKNWYKSQVYCVKNKTFINFALENRR